MEEENINILILGDEMTGKTCFWLSYCNDSYAPSHFPTGFETYTADAHRMGSTIHLTVWDTSSMDDFSELRKCNYINTHIFLVCFCPTDPTTFTTINKWVNEIRQHTNCSNKPIFLVATKNDLRRDTDTNQLLEEKNKTGILPSQGVKLVNDLGLVGYGECSALTGEGVKDIFDAVINIILATRTKAEHINKGSKSSAKKCIIF